MIMGEWGSVVARRIVASGRATSVLACLKDSDTTPLYRRLASLALCLSFVSAKKQSPGNPVAGSQFSRILFKWKCDAINLAYRDFPQPCGPWTITIMSISFGKGKKRPARITAGRAQRPPDLTNGGGDNGERLAWRGNGVALPKGRESLRTGSLALCGLWSSVRPAR